MKKEKITKLIEFWLLYFLIDFIVFLLMKVAPTFADVFVSFGAHLPLSTRIVIEVSSILKPFQNWWSISIGLVINYLLLWHLSKLKNSSVVFAILWIVLGIILGFIIIALFWSPGGLSNVIE